MSEASEEPSPWKDLVAEAQQASASDARRPRQYEPAVQYRAGEMSEVSIPLAQVPADETVWRQEIARVTGLTVPEARKVELAQVRYWGNPEAPSVYCRFLITDRAETVSFDAVKLLKSLRKGSGGKKVARFAGESTFCVSWNDWQVAKKEGGGTPALAERLDAAFSSSVARARELRKINRDLGELVIVGGGDIVEGCGGIFPNQAYEIDSDRRTQVRNATTFALEGLDRLAPLFSSVRVLVVGGNHGENRVGGNRTTRGDNDDCAVFENVALAAERDTRLSHVKFYIAQDEPAKTLDVNGWILGTTHGQAFGKGGGHVAQKALRWFSGQAAGRTPVGDSDLFVSHHFHHFAAQDWGATQWIQTPAMDGGSLHFTDKTGQHSQPGMLTWVMSPESRFADSQVL